jgi:hypothetical protein
VCIPPRFVYAKPQSWPTPSRAVNKIDAIFRGSLFPAKASIWPFCVRAIASRPDFAAHALRKSVVLSWPVHPRLLVYIFQFLCKACLSRWWVSLAVLKSRPRFWPTGSSTTGWTPSPKYAWIRSALSINETWPVSSAWLSYANSYNNNMPPIFGRGTEPSLFSSNTPPHLQHRVYSMSSTWLSPWTLGKMRLGSRNRQAASKDNKNKLAKKDKSCVTFDRNDKITHSKSFWVWKWLENVVFSINFVDNFKHIYDVFKEYLFMVIKVMTLSWKYVLM